MEKVVIFMFFLFCYTIGYSQITLPKFRPTIDKVDLPTMQKDSITDSTFVLSLNNYVLDSVIRTKIVYLKSVFKGFENITINFQSNSQIDYILITGNLPNCFIEKNSRLLVGTLRIDDFRLFVYNYSDKSINNYFIKTNVKYSMPDYEYFDMLINTPTWFYVIRDGTLEEVCQPRPGGYIIK